MTFTETTTQEFLGKNEDLGIQEIIASSQKLLNLNQASNSNNSNSSSNNISSSTGSGSNNITNIGTTTDTPATSAFSLHPEIISQDKNRLRPRKNSKNKHTTDNYFGDASDCSLPASNNGSTPSLLSMTGTGIPSPPIMSTTNLNDNNSNDNNINNMSSSTTNHLHHLHHHNQNVPHNMNSSNFRNIRVKSSSHREKVDADKDMPISPPELIKDPTTEAFSTHAYSWPILFAVIPPMGALIFGKSDVWSDFLLLLLIAFYLYNIIKVPWELYYAARTRRVRKENSPQNKTPPNLEEEASKKQAAQELQRQELYALVLVIASPIVGGYALHGAKMYLTDYDKYISHFNIVLFVFAAGIRPLMHIANLAKNRTLHLQEEVHYPSAEVEMLKKRLQTVESQVAQINRSLATKRDILNVKDGFEPTIVQLNKAVRRYEKKEQYLRNYSEERFAYLEAKLREYDTYIAYKLQEDQSMILPRSMMQIMFMPLNITLTVFGYAKYFLPRFLRGSRQKPMLQPAVSSDNDVDVGIGFNNSNNNNNNNNIISNNNKLVGENIQQQDGSLISGSLQKY